MLVLLMLPQRVAGIEVDRRLDLEAPTWRQPNPGKEKNVVCRQDAPLVLPPTGGVPPHGGGDGALLAV